MDCCDLSFCAFGRRLILGEQRRYTVLLEPDQVELTTSEFLATSLLSNFHIAFSQQRPA